MQRNLVPFIVAALLLSLAATMLSMLTFLRQGDIRTHLATIDQRLADHQAMHIQEATGMSPESLLRDLGVDTASPDDKAGGEGAPATVRPEMRVIPDRRRLDALGLTTEDVTRAVRAAVEARQDFREAVITAPDGRRVRVADVAEFRIIMTDGQPSDEDDREANP
jgi:hypothetical protein